MRPTPLSALPPISTAAAKVRGMADRLRVMRWVFLVSILLVILGQFKPLSTHFYPAFPWILSALGLLGCLSAGLWVFEARWMMTKSDEKKYAYVFGVVFLVVLVVIALAVPDPTAFQYTVFRIILALAAAGVAAMIPGFLSVTVSNWIRAGGALAIFVIVFFYSPAALVGR